jgi:hypothetical protein
VKPKAAPPVAMLPRTGKNALDKPAANVDPAVTKGEPQPAEVPTPRPETPSTAEADRLFVARQYEEAGVRYAALAEQNALPSDRNPHWAYCRKVAVVRRINAHPRTAREWDEIETEIQEVQRLMPNNWFGEYLKNYVAEARRKTRLPSAPGEGVVVRGSAPEEPPPRSSRLSKFLKRAKGDPASDPATGPKGGTTPKPKLGEQPLDLPAEGGPKSGSIEPPPVPQEPATSSAGDPAADPDAAKSAPASTTRPDSLAAASEPATSRPVLGIDGPASEPTPPPTDAQVVRAGANDRQTAGSRPTTAAEELRWQVYETPNFRIYHTNVELAQKAGEVAEQVRSRQAERWASPAARATWTPRCDFYLYTDGKHLARKTGQTETSPGFSTMGTSGNRVTTRLIHLRGDHPDLLAAVLPHEVTHVVMADLFVTQQIPRWADEGIAVMAEPADTQRQRAADLKDPLEMGGLIALDKLMTMDYPAPQHLNLYYAQSISLTRFLVAQGPPEQFLKFVRYSQRSGVEPALREIYQIDGLPALQDRWLAYARQQVLPTTASAAASKLPAAGDRVSR